MQKKNPHIFLVLKSRHQFAFDMCKVWCSKFDGKKIAVSIISFIMHNITLT